MVILPAFLVYTHTKKNTHTPPLHVWFLLVMIFMRGGETPPGLKPHFCPLPSLMSLFFLKGTTWLSAVPPCTAPLTQPQQPHDGTPWPGKTQPLSLIHPSFPLISSPTNSSHSLPAHSLMLLSPASSKLILADSLQSSAPPATSSFYSHPEAAGPAPLHSRKSAVPVRDE